VLPVGKLTAERIKTLKTNRITNLTLAVTTVIAISQLAAVGVAQTEPIGGQPATLTINILVI